MLRNCWEALSSRAREMAGYTTVVPPARKVPGEATADSTVAGAVSSNGRIGLPCLFDGGDDVRVGRAAADVAGHELPHVLDTLLDRRDRRHDLTGRAEPALQRVPVDERLLDRMQLVLSGQSVHG